jgi:hypothetical protein
MLNQSLAVKSESAAVVDEDSDGDLEVPRMSDPGVHYMSLHFGRKFCWQIFYPLFVDKMSAKIANKYSSNHY